MSAPLLRPDYIFETSWEVCNYIGGLHTAIKTKAISLVTEYENNYIVIGPDLVHDSGVNPEFIPDKQLYSKWHIHAQAKGLKIKIGRWKVEGSPIAILVDFSDYLIKKDEIFSTLWEKYKLDSLPGQWDYIEPVLFGYAVGKVIENFVLFNLSGNDKIVAQFHEWMTSAGILYLKKALPQVATVYTNHATVLGRELSAHNRPLYQELKKYNPDSVAKEFKVVSKHSLEKISAAESDMFTTVSEITSEECAHFLGKKVDLITPNGFETSIIPTESDVIEKRKLARSRLLKVASTLISDPLPEDTFILATSGRHEFKNKGIDLFIDALNNLRNKKIGRPIIAFLFTPSNHYGPRKDLQQALEKEQSSNEGSKIITHYLHDPELDPILKRLNKLGFNNNEKDKIKLIYVPSYLNGLDGIFNLSYYDILPGCDQTVFASYYEPWGYAPFESLAFGVPTVTTSLTGIGRWLKDECNETYNAITIIERSDTNDNEVTAQILEAVLSIYSLSEDEKNNIQQNAKKISQRSLWSSLLVNYNNAYHLALQKVSKRSDAFIQIDDKTTEQIHEQILPLTNDPVWKRIIVRSRLPKELEMLSVISDNIWWTWDDDAQELFETIDPKVWRASEYSPEILFEQVPLKRLQALSKDADYISRLQNVSERFNNYLAGIKDLSSPKIAYFSMEFGFHDSLKLFSGGLGILAGDYLKEASDSKIHIVAVGILYRFGYFSQVLTLSGEQQAVYDYQHFSKMPVFPVRGEDGEFKTVQMMLPGRVMYARIWKLHVGRIEMILLDTDFEKNIPQDREVSHKLYGGDKENRLKQELLLGVGGVRALRELGIKSDLFHNNEGHSAFCGMERIRYYMAEEQLTFAEAREIIRSSTLFTTHTPVPAGHDHFDEDLLRKYLGHYPERLKISWEKFMALGRSNPNDWKEKFNMSYLAANLAQEVNGVSMLHGAVSRDMFAPLWPGFLPEELHIGYVTNGVHWPTWTAKEWKTVYNELFEGNFIDHQTNQDYWNRIYDIDDKRIWDLKQDLRTKLISSVKARFKENWIKRHEDPKQIVAINNSLSDKALTIVFARRFATYKRAHLLFRDLDRLSKLLNNEDMPVQFIFAGKAHPADKEGQGLIKMITEVSKKPEFLGKILFLQNYSISLAKLLVSGADIWLNTPTRPLEASGTSGEKAVMNGTLHFSVLDGWWVEGYQPDAGWALTNERTYDNQQFQDDLDAEIIYSILENEILPVFYKRNEIGISPEWVRFIKNSIAKVSPKFTTRRMINDYVNQYYTKQYQRLLKVKENDYEMAKQISSWKKRMTRSWNNIEIIDVKLFEQNTDTIDTGTKYHGQIVLDLNEINPSQVGVELIVTENMRELVSIQQFKLIDSKDGKAIFKIDFLNDQPGTFNYGIRAYPQDELLPHRQDFGLLRWI